MIVRVEFDVPLPRPDLAERIGTHLMTGRVG
jgi:hypothetical protein